MSAGPFLFSKSGVLNKKRSLAPLPFTSGWIETLNVGRSLFVFKVRSFKQKAVSRALPITTGFFLGVSWVKTCKVVPVQEKKRYCMRRACFLRFTTVLHITPFFYSHYRRIRQTDITNIGANFCRVSEPDICPRSWSDGLSNMNSIYFWNPTKISTEFFETLQKLALNWDIGLTNS